MQKFRAWFVFGIIAGLAACTTNPYTGERQAGKSAIYGGGAAVLCGLVGAIESGKHARNAALGCGAVGAGIGAYMDVQEAKLREELANTGVGISREGNNIRLIMPGNITFDTNNYHVKSSFYPVLNSVSAVLSKYYDTTLKVTGHTDSTGSMPHNQELSEQRAQSVADYLASQGVARQRLYAEGMGPTQPIADNESNEGRAKNRRVELYVLPKS